jgi:hypothetical protein
MPALRSLCANDFWQIDGTQVSLSDGSPAWVIDILDDHAHFAIGGTATRRFTAMTAWRAMETAIIEHGTPRQPISDNGTPVHLARWPPARAVPATAGRDEYYRQLSSRPGHPQTCGKLERYHRAFKDF